MPSHFRAGPMATTGDTRAGPTHRGRAADAGRVERAALHAMADVSEAAAAEGRMPHAVPTERHGGGIRRNGSHCADRDRERGEGEHLARDIEHDASPGWRGRR